MTHDSCGCFTVTAAVDVGPGDEMTITTSILPQCGRLIDAKILINASKASINVPNKMEESVIDAAQRTASQC